VFHHEFVIVQGVERSAFHVALPGLDRRLGDHLEHVVIGHVPEVIDRGSPVVGEGEDPGDRNRGQAVGQQPLLGQIAGSDPDLVVGLPDVGVVPQPHVVADAESHASAIPGRTNWACRAWM
jgi:hypothetical protein